MVTAETTDSRAPVSARPILICILGMHRSGTSALASYVHALGATIGPNRLETISAVNAEGFWEDSVVVAINEALLAAAGRSWFDHRAWQVESIGAQQHEQLHNQALAHMRDCYGNQPLTVLKDPRLCRLLPFWLDVWDKVGFSVRCLYAIRHPVMVASSLYTRDRIPYEYAVLLWLRYTLDAITNSSEVAGIVVPFDVLLEQPVLLPQALTKELGIELPCAEASWRNLAASSLDTRLRHNRVATSVAAQLPWVRLALDVFAALSDAAFKKIDQNQLHGLLLGYQSVLDEDNEYINALQRVSNELMWLSAEAVRVGELHTKALRVIESRSELIKDIKYLRIWRLLPRVINRIRKK